jgi:hypothetical protein
MLLFFDYKSFLTHSTLKLIRIIHVNFIILVLKSINNIIIIKFISYHPLP